MHCSGTSATARILALLGVDMGPPEVARPAVRTNTKGLWEHPGLTRIGELVLRALGGTWSAPPALAPGWLAEPALEPHREAAREIVESVFGDSPLWGWKDPRSSLLVAFWQDLLGPMHHVVCVRHPEDVAASLTKRDGMPRQQSLALWLRYTRDLVEATRGRPRAFIFYEDLWAGDGALRRLAELVGAQDALGSAELRAAVDEWLDPEMWNNRTGAASGADELARLPPEVARLYGSLLTLRAS